MFYLVWCNVLIYVNVGLLVPVRVHCVSLIDVICYWASRNRRSSFGDPETKLFEFYEIEDPELLFGEVKCPLICVVLVLQCLISNFELHDVKFYRFPLLYLIYHIHDYVLLIYVFVGGWIINIIGTNSSTIIWYLPE
jgi:hypothetical protein